MKRHFLLYILFLPIFLYGQSWPCFYASHDTARTVTLLFAGDLMQHQEQIDAARRPDGSYDYRYCFSLVKPLIRKADIAIGNLEVTLGGKPYRGYPQFSAPDEFLMALRDAGFDVLATANNHCLDRRNRGLLRTLRLTDSVGIATMGTYADTADRTARYPLLIECQGIRFAFICATYGTNGFREHPPVLVNRLQRDEMAADIRRARALHPDVLIALVHWGNEYQRQPNAQQEALGKWLISQGVDHVIGSHPHVLQPICTIDDEVRYQQHVIAYSLGNFVSNMSMPHTDVGAMLQLTFTRVGHITRLQSHRYQLVWTQRPPFSPTHDFRIVPYDTAAYGLSPYVRKKMLRCIHEETKLLESVRGDDSSGYLYQPLF